MALRRSSRTGARLNITRSWMLCSSAETGRLPPQRPHMRGPRHRAKALTPIFCLASWILASGRSLLIWVERGKDRGWRDSRGAIAQFEHQFGNGRVAAERVRNVASRKELERLGLGQDQQCQHGALANK